MPFKPMLAARLKPGQELDTIRYPKLASTKLDGIRAVIQDGVVLSRRLKPIKNLYIQETFGKSFLNGLDGELIVGRPWSKNCFNTTQSGVMSVDGNPQVRFHVFDYFEPQDTFWMRYKTARAIVAKAQKVLPCYEVRKDVAVSCIKMVEQIEVFTPEQLAQWEETWLKRGYEGGIIRDPMAPYKEGRSTLRQEWMIKLKRFLDSDAVVTGFNELMHNGNEAVINELGKTKRSSHKANMVPMGTLGSLNATDVHTGVDFSCSSFDDLTRLEIWQNRPNYVGKIFKYKFFPIGVKDKPRHPIFLGWRDEIDM